jgi:hypothetical protein
VNIERNAGLLSCGLERCRTAGVPNLGSLPGLWVPKEELRQCGAPSLGLGDGIELIAMPADLQPHGFDPTSGPPRHQSRIRLAADPPAVPATEPILLTSLYSGSPEVVKFCL